MTNTGQYIVVGGDGAAFAIAEAAIERGYRVRVLVPRGVPTAKFFPADLTLSDLDWHNLKRLCAQIETADTVFYCAGPGRLPIDENEPDRVSMLVKACARVCAKLVYCDLPYAYGAINRSISEDLPWRAKDPFGVFLSALASHVLRANQTGQIQSVVARHADLIGPDVVRSPFGEAFVSGVLKGTPQKVPGRTDAPRSLTFVRDLGRAAILLAERDDIWGHVWHVPTLPPVSPIQLADMVRNMSGLRPLANCVVRDVPARSALSLITGEKPCAARGLARTHMHEFHVLSTKFERAFGLHATSIGDAIGMTVDRIEALAS